MTGAGSTWTNIANVVVGGIGTGALTIQNGGTVNSGGGGSVGQSVGSLGTVTVTGPGSSWNNGPAAGSISAVLARDTHDRNGGTVINISSFTANIGIVQARRVR